MATVCRMPGKPTTVSAIRARTPMAMGKPTYPLVIMILAGLGKVALSFWLVPLYGMNAQAALMSGYFAITIGLIVWQGLHQVQLHETGSVPAG